MKISGNQTISVKDIENSLKEKINQRFFFFSTQSIFLINSKEVKKTLSIEFPKIDKINLKRKLPATLIVEIQERMAIGVLCQKGECFSVDKTGVIFENNLPTGGLIVKLENNNTPFLPGKRIIEENVLKAILEIRDKIETNFKIVSKEFVILSEERINLKTSDGWEIYFNPRKDLNWQLTKLGLVLEKQIPQERRKDLEYIDLRFGNLAPYKYKEK